MAKTSIGDLHARVTADASQYDAEMKRAAAATQRTARSVNGQLDELQRNISRKFTLGDIGKDLLKGLGLGSGFAVAQTAVDLITTRYREQAEAAETVVENLKRQLELTRQIIALRQSPEQQLNALKKQRAEIEARRDQFLDTSRRTITAPLPPGWALMSKEELEAAKNKKVVVDLTQEQQVEVAKLRTQIMELTKEIDTLTISEEKRIETQREQLRVSDQTRRINALSVGLRNQEEAFEGLVKAARDSNEESKRAREEREREARQLDNIAERYRQLADPMREYLERVREINEAEAAGRLTVDQATRARAITIDESPAGKAFAMSQQRFAQEIPKMEEETRVLAAAAQDMGFAFSSAFENAVIAGEKLSDVMRSLAQDILRVFLRLAVTNPLINSIFGGVSGFQALPTLFGGPKADGGPVTSGTSYLVGERGPELFVPRQSGVIVPNHAMAGGNGVTVNLTTNFASGVTRQEVAAMLPRMVEAAKSAVAEAVGRGGGYRRAFA